MSQREWIVVVRLRYQQSSEDQQSEIDSCYFLMNYQQLELHQQIPGQQQYKVLILKSLSHPQSYHTQ